MTNFISMASVFFTEAETKRKWAVVPHTWPRIPSTKLGLQSWRTQQCWTCKHGVHNFRPKAYEITDFLRNNTKFKGVIVVTVAIVMLVRCCFFDSWRKRRPTNSAHRRDQSIWVLLSILRLALFCEGSKTIKCGKIDAKVLVSNTKPSSSCEIENFLGWAHKQNSHSNC